MVLCERGIKTFDAELRNTLDLAGVALAKELCHLPSSSIPRTPPVGEAWCRLRRVRRSPSAADGIIVEVHPCPERALSDGPQSLDLAGFAALMKGLQPAIEMVAAGR